MAGLFMTLALVADAALAGVLHWRQRRRLLETMRDVAEGMDTK
jgi:hypothetical protein